MNGIKVNLEIRNNTNCIYYLAKGCSTIGYAIKYPSQYKDSHFFKNTASPSIKYTFTFEWKF